MSEHALVVDCHGDQLVAILHRPDAVRHIGVLVVVGGPQYRVGSHRQFVTMARDLAAAGFPTMRFDYRGMGDSEGAARSFESVDDDISVAVEQFFAHCPELRKVVLFGLCDAASAILMLCRRRDARIAGIVLANPWVRTESGLAKAYVQHYYGRRLLQRSFWQKVLRGEFETRAALKGFAASVRRALRPAPPGVDVGNYIERMQRGLEAFGAPVLLLMSGRDLTAREFDAMAVGSSPWRAALARDTVTRLDLPDADHTFSSRAAKNSVADAIVAWIEEGAAQRTGAAPSSGATHPK